MKNPRKTVEVRLERNIAAPVGRVFDGWLDPKLPGTPWNEADKFVLNPEVDGLFFWEVRETAHYGRFTKVERPGQLQHTWVSPYTHGHESIVTVTFEPRGEGTLMTLVHSGLPDAEAGRAHQKGWTYFLGVFPDQFPLRKKKKKG
jgi:uncharacterized protein YndB with AHSA1/START domain